MAYTFLTAPRCGLRRIFLGLVLTLAAPLSGAVTWEPVPPEQRTAQAPSDDPDAVAEMLYWRIDLVVKNYKATQRNLQRVKIYSERAVEELGKLGVEYTENEKISELAARVVHADGRTTELPEGQFQTLVLGRINQARQMARRLVVPRLVPGDIVELQWRADEDGRFKGSRFIYCQQTIPVRKFEFFLRNSLSGPLNLASFGAKDSRLDGYGTNKGHLVINRLPAYVAEPDMPPAFNMRASVLVMYGKIPEYENTSWSLATAFLKIIDAERCAVTKEIRQEATRIITGQEYREEQLRRIYAYCQESIANVAYDESPASLAERSDYREPRTAAAVLKDRRGNALEINCLFAALAKAAGFEARLTFSADRTEVLSVQFSHGWFFMKTSGVQVKLAGEWRLLAPGDRAVPFGLSRWQREGSETFSIQDNFIHWDSVTTGFKQQARNLRSGRAVIDLEGGLTADITERKEGHEAIAWREEHWNAGPATWEKIVRDEVREELPEAEVSDVRIEHLTDTTEPVILHYRVRLANYATTSGERRLIVPSFFHLHAQPRYELPQRVNAIWWKYAQQEVDDFDLILPPGYELETPGAPAPVNDTRGILQHRVTMSYYPTENRLHYHREAMLGRADSLAFDASAYPALQRLFAQINQAQTHALVLKPKGDPAHP